MADRLLRLGSRGQQVQALQTLLRRYEPGLHPDGVYGPATERAVRKAQRRLGLFPPDGIAGPQTNGALMKATQPAERQSLFQQAQGAARQAGEAITQFGADVWKWFSEPAAAPKPVPPALKRAVEPARERAKSNEMPPGQVADPKTMKLSQRGRQFMFFFEASDPKVTAHLHFPGGSSGVTIGPGYDMKKRSRAEITAALTRIGVPLEKAQVAAQAAGLVGAQARDFAKEHKSLITLSINQQVALQVNYKASYEDMVRRAIRIPLHQYEYDALVSYATNPGSKEGWQTTTRLVNEGKPKQAMETVKKYVFSGKTRYAGLVTRRDREARLFLYGEYK